MRFASAKESFVFLCFNVENGSALHLCNVSPSKRSQLQRLVLSKYLCHLNFCYTLSEAWSGVSWADLMAPQGAFGTDFYDRSTRMIVGTMLWTEYNRPVIKIGPKGAMSPIHSAPNRFLPQIVVLVQDVQEP